MSGESGFNDLPLFQQPKVEEKRRANNQQRRNLREETANWIERHPAAANLLLCFARELAQRGRKFGIGLLAERLRWEVAIQGLDREEYKINNNHRAYIARWLIRQDPSLEPFMRFREVGW